MQNKKPAAQSVGKQAYQELLEMTVQALTCAAQTKKELSAKRLVESLNYFIPLT